MFAELQTPTPQNLPCFRGGKRDRKRTTLTPALQGLWVSWGKLPESQPSTVPPAVIGQCPGCCVPVGEGHFLQQWNSQVGTTGRKGKARKASWRRECWTQASGRIPFPRKAAGRQTIPVGGAVPAKARRQENLGWQIDFNQPSNSGSLSGYYQVAI